MTEPKPPFLDVTLAIIQTLHPDHYSIRRAVAQDYEGFYADELRFRQAMAYPPAELIFPPGEEFWHTDVKWDYNVPFDFKEVKDPELIARLHDIAGKYTGKDDPVIAGAAMFYGSSFITPALSVMSAIEGLKVATPAFEPLVLPLTIVILVALFSVQSHGTKRVSAFFAPITAMPADPVKPVT